MEAGGFFDKAKAAVGQAAGKAKEEVVELQTRRELGQAQKDLGVVAFGLVESGELEHPALVAPAERVRELSARLEDGAEEPEPTEEAGEADESDGAEPW
jgi:cob(I)alamin adenosyltransferase